MGRRKSTNGTRTGTPVESGVVTLSGDLGEFDSANGDGNTSPLGDSAGSDIRDSGTSSGEDGTETGDGIFTSIGDAFGSGAEDGTETGTPIKRKRGRPKGSGKGSSQKTKTDQTSLDGIEAILLNLHMMGAAFLKVPELQLSPEEAEKLSEAIARVSALYDFGASEKTLAWVNLTMALGSVYGTRIFAYSLRMKAEAQSKKKPEPIPFPTYSTQP